MSESTLERRSGKLYRTVTDTALREGVSTNPSESSFICNVAAGTEVLVTHAQGRRAYIVQPQEGWVSLQKSNGEVILQPVDDTTLVKKNFSGVTQGQTKRTVPQERYNNAYKWDHQRNILRKVLIPNDLIDMKTVTVITGISVANSKVVPGLACIAICTMSYPELNEIHSRKEVVRLTNRAIDGYACFREKEAFCKLYETFAEYRVFLQVQKKLENQVNVVMINRNGLFDKEGFGLASLFGTQFKVTTMGIVPQCTAQRYVQRAYGSTEQLFTVAQPSFEGETMLTQEEVDEQIGNALQKPNSVDIKHDSNALCCALKLQADHDPVYVSVGHGCCLESAVDLCRKSSKGYIPEPLLRANLATETTMREQDAKYEMLDKMRASPAVSPMSAAFGGVAIGEV